MITNQLTKDGDIKIDSNTELILQKEKRWKELYWQIGKLLIENREIIKEGKSKYATFNEYFDSCGFEFGIKTAFKIIKVIETYGSSASATLSISKLVELTYIPDSEIREELTKIAIKEHLTKAEIRNKVREAKYSNIGKPLEQTEASDLPEDTKEQEYELKIRREVQTLLRQFESYELQKQTLKRFKGNLQVAIETFIKEVSKRIPNHSSILQAEKLLGVVSNSP